MKWPVGTWSQEGTPEARDPQSTVGNMSMKAVVRATREAKH